MDSIGSASSAPSYDPPSSSPSTSDAGSTDTSGGVDDSSSSSSPAESAPSDSYSPESDGGSTEPANTDDSHVSALGSNFGGSPEAGAGEDIPSTEPKTEDTRSISGGDDKPAAPADDAQHPPMAADEVEKKDEPASPGLTGGNRPPADPPDPGDYKNSNACDAKPAEWKDDRNGQHSRTEKACDDKGDWTRVKDDKTGAEQRSRTYEEDGKTYRETESEGNKWRYREGGYEGLAAESRAKGNQRFDMVGPKGSNMEVVVHGNPTDAERDKVKQVLESMPPDARQHARQVFLSDNLGTVYASKPGEKDGSVAGMAGDSFGRMVIDRNSFMGPQGAGIITHEAGHNMEALERSRGADPVLNPVWADSSKSFSTYGQRSHAEDFAETHRFVMQNIDSYRTTGGPGATPVRQPGDTGIPSTARAQDILMRYGYPSDSWTVRP